MTKKLMLQQFGHWCNPNLPLWQRVNLTLKNTPVIKLINNYKRRQTAFHNLCETLKPPPGTDQLLWLGLKFCIQPSLPKPTLDTYMDRLTYDIRTKYVMAGTELERNQANGHSFPTDDKSEYNPKLYLPSTNFTPEPAPQHVEDAITQLYDGLQQRININKQNQRRCHNIPPTTRQALRQLKQDDRFIVVPTDKNLGPAIMERGTYIRWTLGDHLLDTENYIQLTPEAATIAIKESVTKMKQLLETYDYCLSDHERIYFKRVFQQEH
jgi:hypothetical protein